MNDADGRNSGPQFGTAIRDSHDAVVRICGRNPGFLAGGTALEISVFHGVKSLPCGDTVAGFHTLIVATLTLGGLNLVGLGVLGQYLGRLCMETKRGPRYLVDAIAPPRSRTEHQRKAAVQHMPVSM